MSAAEERLRKLEAMDTPWPLRDTLKRLVVEVDHLLDEHSCDCHGWEGAVAARDSAKRIIAENWPEPGEPGTG